MLTAATRTALRLRGTPAMARSVSVWASVKAG